MVSEDPTPPPTLTATRAVDAAAVAFVNFYDYDKIQICGISSAHELAAVNAAIRSNWPLGVSELKQYPGSDPIVPRGRDGFPMTLVEIKLTGRPWQRVSREAWPVRRLVAALVRALLEAGWRIDTVTNVARSKHNKDVWVLVRGERVTFANDRDVFAIGFDNGRKLSLPGAPDDVSIQIRSAVAQAWPDGIGEVGGSGGEDGELWLRLNGNPWCSDGFQIPQHTIASRLVLARMVAALRRCGYSVYASVNTCCVKAEEGDLDTWIVVKNVNDL
ncbi:hypothetical protein H9P43_007207 [Blastocladiella emersonii ATCC 22665]|nr:hypothetical protein H9P43_007207 [Blastocladiella emersonii ATCC 22665]